MIDIYCDESRDDHVYALGGWVASPTGWKFLVPEWQKMLSRFSLPDGSPLTCFHANLITSRDVAKHNPFKGWTFEDEKAVFTAAVDVIADVKNGAGNLWPVGCAIVAPREPKGVEDAEKTIWHMLFCRLFLALINQFPAQNGFRFVFDEKKELEAPVNEFYAMARVIVERYMPGKLAGESVTFDTDTALPQLQAADLFVYEWRRRISDRVAQPSKAVRKSYERIKKSRFDSAVLHCYERQVLDGMVAALAAGESSMQFLFDSESTLD